MKKNKQQKRFLGNVSYEEHQVRVKHIYEEEVLPLLKKQLESTNNKEKIQSIKETLTPAQKAHLNCHSPI